MIKLINLNDTFNDQNVYRVLDVNGDVVCENCKGFNLKQITEQYCLDLMLVNNTVSPYIVKLIDYQKYQYQLKRTNKENKKKQKLNIQKNKEIKFHIGIADNDFKVKVNHIKQFLSDHCKVKVTIFFRGRENTRKEEGRILLNKILAEFNNIVKIDNDIKSIGNTIFTYLY